MVKITFVGPGKYVGNGLEFSMNDPDSLEQEVEDSVAKQLVEDFPDMFSAGKKSAKKSDEEKESDVKSDEVVDEVLRNMEKFPLRVTKDQINDWAAVNKPEVELNSSMKKQEMIDALLA